MVQWARRVAFILCMGAILLPEVFRLQEREVFPLALVAVGRSVFPRLKLFLQSRQFRVLISLR